MALPVCRTILQSSIVPIESYTVCMYDLVYFLYTWNIIRDHIKTENSTNISNE